ncbi:MAG: hypothetical protein KKG75_05750 [Nanoarchaeota archaeon]|nr:hypothetical protein [Nanoarchaeota archaeon]
MYNRNESRNGRFVRYMVRGIVTTLVVSGIYTVAGNIIPGIIKHNEGNIENIVEQNGNPESIE